MNKRGIIVFQKNKELGKVKTRLAAGVGDEKALLYYERMIAHTHSVLKETDADVHIFYSNFKEESNSDKIGTHIQHGDDLGIRMFNAFTGMKTIGYEKVVIIGTDCLELKSETIEKAFKTLENNDFVIGPATDGGYYLIGLKVVLPSLFLNKTWSTEDVFDVAIESIKKEKKSVGIIEKLNDIDNLDDLKSYESKFGVIKI